MLWSLFVEWENWTANRAQVTGRVGTSVPGSGPQPIHRHKWKWRKWQTWRDFCNQGYEFGSLQAAKVCAIHVNSCQIFVRLHPLKACARSLLFCKITSRASHPKAGKHRRRLCQIKNEKNKTGKLASIYTSLLNYGLDRDLVDGGFEWLSRGRDLGANSRRRWTWELLGVCSWFWIMFWLKADWCWITLLLTTALSTNSHFGFLWNHLLRFFWP